MSLILNISNTFLLFWTIDFHIQNNELGYCMVKFQKVQNEKAFPLKMDDLKMYDITIIKITIVILFTVLSHHLCKFSLYGHFFGIWQSYCFKNYFKLKFSQ